MAKRKRITPDPQTTHLKTNITKCGNVEGPGGSLGFESASKFCFQRVTKPAAAREGEPAADGSGRALAGVRRDDAGVCGRGDRDHRGGGGERRRLRISDLKDHAAKAKASSDRKIERTSGVLVVVRIEKGGPKGGLRLTQISSTRNRI